MTVKKLKLLVLAIGLISIVFIFNPKLSYSQSCGGSGSTTYTAYDCEFDENEGYSCSGRQRTVSNGCNWLGNSCVAQMQRSDFHCSANSNGCTINDSTYTSGSGCSITQPPPPPDPDDPPPPPSNTCAGDCFTGIANCGAVGRVSGAGTCTNGGMCCGTTVGGGGPGPTATCQVDLTSIPRVVEQWSVVDFDARILRMSSFSCRSARFRTSGQYNTSGQLIGWHRDGSPNEITVNGQRRYPNQFFAFNPTSPSCVTGVEQGCVAEDVSMFGKSSNNNCSQGADEVCDTERHFKVIPAAPPCVVTFNPPTTSFTNNFGSNQNRNVTLNVAVTNGSTVRNVELGTVNTSFRDASLAGRFSINPDDFEAPPQPPYSIRLSLENDMVLQPGYVEAVVELNSNNFCVGYLGLNGATPPPVPTTSAWWQARNGDVITGGSIRSVAPAGQYFLSNSTSNSPGLVIFGPNPSTANYGNTDPSSTRWQSRTTTSIDSFNYATAASLASNVTFVAPGSNLASPTAASDGYVWLRADNSYTINSAQTINKKVVLFVNGDLTINAPIRVSNKNTDFFMAIVSGNINIGSSVGGSAVGTNDLEGLYFANGNFNTGTGANALQVNGSVVALGTITLGRDLAAGNSRAAETFTWNPAYLVNYPGKLAKDRFIWREVAP